MKAPDNQVSLSCFADFGTILQSQLGHYLGHSPFCEQKEQSENLTLLEFAFVDDPLCLAHAALYGAGFNQPDGGADAEQAGDVCLDALA